MTEVIRCAMISLVVSFSVPVKLSLIFASVAVSTALVLSSRIRIFGCFKRALAIHNRCFWPPDTLTQMCIRDSLYIPSVPGTCTHCTAGRILIQS